MSATSLFGFRQAQADAAGWLVENAVGAHLLAGLQGPQWRLACWRANGDEADFVVERGARCRATEVKSGRAGKPRGIGSFVKRYRGAKAWIVGDSGIPLPFFFSRPAGTWFEQGWRFVRKSTVRRSRLVRLGPQPPLDQTRKRACAVR